MGFIAAASSRRGFKKLREIPKAAVLRAAFRVALTRPDHVKRMSDTNGHRDSGALIRRKAETCNPL